MFKRLLGARFPKGTSEGVDIQLGVILGLSVALLIAEVSFAAGLHP